MTVKEAYQKTVSMLEPFTDEAEAEARAILAHVLGCDHSDLHLRFLHVFADGRRLGQLIKQRCSGMPLAYVLGYKYFYGHRFFVDRRVLIPRWDSECVVERAVALAGAHGYKTMLDLCCGSGCMGLTMLMESDVRAVEFIDISQPALDVTKQNAEELFEQHPEAIKPGTMFQFTINNMLIGLDGSYDLILCNPPYVSEREYAGLDAQIRDYEPRSALIAGHEGYVFYERLAKDVPMCLNPGGAVVVEIGSTQAERVMQLFADVGLREISFGRDLNNLPRWVSAML